MTEKQRCPLAATAPACPNSPVALPLLPAHLEKIRAAQTAYQRQIAIRATDPERSDACARWHFLAEELAVAIIQHAEAAGLLNPSEVFHG